MVASSIPSQHESTPRVDAIHRNSADTVLQSHSPGMAGQRSTDSAAKAKGAGEDPSLGSADPENAPEQQALGEKPQLHFRSHGLRDPQVRPMLLGILKGLGPMVAVLCLVVIWGLLPVYWGSLYQLTGRRLPAWVVNGDPNGLVGQAIERGILASSHPGNPRRLKWYSKPWDQYPLSAIQHSVVREFDAWIVVRVAENATALLEQARATGDANWDPSSLITLYYASSRNFNAVPQWVAGSTSKLVESILFQTYSDLTTSWLSQVRSSSNATALLAAVEAAPQTITHPVWYSEQDLRPFDQSVTVATTFVGLIYTAIVTFNVTMALYQLRQGLQVYLKPRSLLLFRFIVPTVTYLPISLLFSMINLPFKVNFARLGPNNAAGFFAFFATTYVGFLTIGFWIEILVSMLTPKLAVIGLVLLICTGVAGCNYPIEMLNSFYKWEYAMPFYNLKAIYTTIIFDVGKQIHILKHIGILWAWLAVLLLTFPFWIFHEQRGSLKARGLQGAELGRRIPLPF